MYFPWLVKWIDAIITKLQLLSNRLTTSKDSSKIDLMMSTRNITPENYNRVKSQEEEARRARNAEIRRMRASDPKYWTYERLGKHWNLSKQNIQFILEKNDD